MHYIVLIDLVKKDPPLIKSLYRLHRKTELFELVIAASLRRTDAVSIYCLYPETFKCIYPSAGKGLAADLAALNEVRLTEEADTELDEMQALAGICVRALLSTHPDGRILVLTNFHPRWETSTLDFARQKVSVHSAENRPQTRQLLRGLVESAAPLRLEAVLTFPTDVSPPPPQAELRLTLTPAIVLTM